MSYGLEIRDAQGNVTLSMTSRTTRVWGEWSFHSSEQYTTHFLSLPAVSGDGSWLAFALYTTAEYGPTWFRTKIQPGSGIQILRYGPMTGWANFKVYVFRV